MKEREIAFNCLVKIVIDKQYSNITLRNCKENTPLITQLVYGTLRNYRLTRELWLKYVNKIPNNRIAVLLDMAVYELLILNKPSYATVNEVVDISKKIGKGSYTNLVNAVLRKISEAKVTDFNMNITYSHPDWLVNLWNAHYGKEITEKICLYDNKEAKVCLRANPLVISEEQLLKDTRFHKGEVEGSLYFDGNIIRSDYFSSGAVIVQSESSQKAVLALDVKEGYKVLDMCAAPGGKTIQIGQLMNNTGKVVANDIYDFRVQLIKDNVKKYGLTNVEAVNHDGLKLNEYYKEESFDAVLLDAPCSGLGTLRHKPEIKMFIQPTDLDNIVALQGQLLEVASKMVKTKGTLVYSTCTLNKKENEKQIEKFLKQHSEFKVISEETIFPFTYDSDGFFICRLEKAG